MLYILRRSSPYVLAFFPFTKAQDVEKPVDKELLSGSEKMTAIDKIKTMFYKDEYGIPSPELQYCIHVSTMGLIVGAFYGAFIQGRSAFVKFIDKNEATMFRNHLDAKRQLQDTMSLAVAKGAFQWGWRMFFFTSIYGFTATVVSLVRGKSGILEHTDGGLLAGAIYNMKNGVRGAIVGGGLGSVLGTIFGSVSYSLLWLTGNTMEDVRFYTYEWQKKRQVLSSTVERNVRIKKEEEAILKTADDFIKEEVENLKSGVS